MRRLFFCVLCLLCQWTAQAAHAGLIAEKAYIRDAAGNASVESVEAGDFRAFEGNFQMLFETKPVWVRLTLQAAPQTETDKLSATGPQVLRVGPHALDHIELYERVAGKWVRQIAGDLHANTRRLCPDDYHCFALTPGHSFTDPVYLRIQTPGLASLDIDVQQGQALMATVSSRVTALTLSITVALCLLCIGMFMGWNRKTPLFLIYCLFQASVIVFLATNTGMIERLLPVIQPETHNFLGQASLIARYFFMLLAGWVVLAYHQPTRLYSRMMQGLAVNSAVSMTLLILGHVQTALLLNMLNFYCIPLVQIYGILTARHQVGSRYVLLAAYGINTLMLAVGTVYILGGIVNTKLYSAINTGGDWRLNGLFVGVVFFLIIFGEDRSRRADKDKEIEALRRSSEQARTNEEKLNERSALIDMLTHELKNPLGTIQFSLATLKRALTGDADSLQRVQRIEVSVKRMDDLIEHVANSNKIDRTGVFGQRERMPARELVQELLDEYPTLARFEVHIQEGAAFLADRKMLTLILENLLSNACKYSVPEASIKVAVTLQPGAGTGGAAAADVGLTCFEVSNEVAQGQEPDESRVFERYYRHHGVQDQPGMGIGLSLVQSAAEKIGATVGYSRQGPRVFFNVRIPN
jgi:signal transduction histidine kinase